MPTAEGREVIKESWFETPIWYGTLPYDFSKALDKFLMMPRTDEGVSLSNRGGYQSHDISKTQDVDIQQLLNLVEFHVEKIILSLKPYNPLKIRMGNAWVNINTKNCYNTKHVHSFTHFSAVLYLKTPKGGGDITFYRPDTAKYFLPSYMIKSFDMTVTYTPVANTLLLFPAWVEHEVGQNLSEEERVSVAFNFILENLQ